MLIRHNLAVSIETAKFRDDSKINSVNLYL